MLTFTTGDFTIHASQASNPPYLSVLAEDQEGLELVLNNLELCGMNPYQEFPPETDYDALTILIKPEVLCMLLSFEILNYGV